MNDLAEYSKVIEETMRRHPAWMDRLATERYRPMSHIGVIELQCGDIIDVRDFGVDAEEDEAYLTISHIRRDEKGVHGFSGKLESGTLLSILRPNGVPMNRKRVVRYIARSHI